MKILVAIPSKNRYHRIGKFTHEWIQHTGVDYKVFVEPQDLVLYKREIPAKNLVSIGENNQGLCYCLNKIGLYAQVKGYDLVFKIDDDCKGFERYPSNGRVQDFQDTLREAISAFAYDPSISAVRFIQKRFWLFSKRETHLFSHEDYPIWGICLYRVDQYPTIPPECKQFTDTVQSLYLWRDGGKTVTYRNAGVAVLQNQGAGGCNSFNRRHLSEGSIARVQKDFPKVGIKKNSNDLIGIDIDISAYLNGKTLNAQSDINIECQLLISNH